MEDKAPEKEKLVGVPLVRAILGNLHDSLKWLWLIVMGLAVVNAIKVYANLLDPSAITSPLNLVNMFISEHTVVFVSFVLVFVRFYFGDSRYLDLSYEETQYRRGLRNEVKKYSGIKRFFDIMLLLNHGTFFYFMSFHMGNATYYIYFFVILMVVNVFWLMLQVLAGINALEQDNDPLIGGVKSFQPMLVWTINNLVFALAITYVTFATTGSNIAWALALSILNSLIDLAATWKFYFPPLEQILEHADSIVEKR